MAARRGLGGLDWLNFFVANVQTGFGPFIAVYLTTQAWTQAEIGEALSLGTAVAMVSQLPAGALVDRLRDKRSAAAVAGCAVAASALLFAVAPTRLAVLAAEILHSFGSAMLGPAIAAISLALVGHAGLGERLGRNARFASLGNALAAGALGTCGAYFSSRAVFWLTALLMIPAMVALRATRAAPVTPEEATPQPASAPGNRRGELWTLLANRRTVAFAASAALFHLGNAALLPLAAGNVTREAGDVANLLIALSIILPQGIVAAISPWVGRAADHRGLRAVLVAGFAAVPLRAALLAVVADDPVLLVAVQALDGVSAAVFGVLLPVVAADLTRGTGRFNLCMGVLGLASAAGGALSTLLAGLVADDWGQRAAFLVLAACGVLASLSALTLARKTNVAAGVRPRALTAPEISGTPAS